MKRILILCCAAVTFVSCGGAQEVIQETDPVEPLVSSGMIELIDPGLDQLVSTDSVIEYLAGGFGFIEGPVWVTAGGPFLLFSDIPANRIVKWTPDGQVSNFLFPVFDGDYEQGRLVGSNGITVDPDGNVVFTEHYGRRISRMLPDGSVTTVVDSYEGNRFSSPNDLAYKSDGSLYFTDPPYGLPTPDDREIEVNGIYRLDSEGTLFQLAELPGPNGIAFSPDESRLYVADSTQNLWMVYEVGSDGSLNEGSVFLDASQVDESGAADGLKVDRDGNLWATGPGGVWVISPDGRHLGTIKPNEVPANVGWGDDGSTLYMTARTGLYRVATNVSGTIP